MNVSDVLPDYLADIKHLATYTQYGYQYHLTLFAQWCEEHSITLEQVNNKHIHIFLEWLKDTRKPHRNDKEQVSSRTIGGYLGSISTFLHWCLQDEEYSQYVTLARVKGIKRPRKEHFIKDVYTDEEIQALFNACKHPDKTHEYQLRDIAILAVFLDTGIRAEELRTLTIEHVFLAKQVQEDSYIRVMGKGRKEREIPLGNKARRALNRYMRECRRNAKKTELVFVSRQTGQALSHRTVFDMMLRLKNFSTLPEDAQVNPHKFRHTFATRYMLGGGDIYDLSRLLGHTSVQITEEYLKTLGVDIVRKRTKVNRTSVLDSL